MHLVMLRRIHKLNKNGGRGRGSMEGESFKRGVEVGGGGGEGGGQRCNRGRKCGTGQTENSCFTTKPVISILFYDQVTVLLLSV